MTRPSSRAAFLFRSSGQPVARRDFEATLEKTDALLGERGGQRVREGREEDRVLGRDDEEQVPEPVAHVVRALAQRAHLPGLAHDPNPYYL